MKHEQFDRFDLEKNLCIKGDLLQARISLTHYEILNMGSSKVNLEDYVKEKLAIMIAKELIYSKYFSFTKLENNNQNTTDFYARISVVPPNITQEIRKILKPVIKS